MDADDFRGGMTLTIGRASIWVYFEGIADPWVEFQIFRELALILVRLFQDDSSRMIADGGASGDSVDSTRQPTS